MHITATRLFNIMKRTKITISILITIISLILLSCENEKSGSIDTNFDTPFLILTSITRTIVNLDEDTTGIVVPLSDNKYQLKLGVTIIALKHNPNVPANAYINLYKPKANSAFLKYPIKLERYNSDTIIYSDEFTFKIQRSDVGFFTLESFIQLDDGKKTNSIHKSLQVIRKNSRPIITSIIMPDSLTLGQIPSPDSSFLVQAAVTDSDGINDIQFVYFYSRKPDNTIGNCGYPAQLYDDGSLDIIFPPNYRSGDIVAGDGIYSLRIALKTRFKNNCPPPDTVDTQRGFYTFTFYAMDKSSAISDSVTKVWLVK